MEQWEQIELMVRATVRHSEEDSGRGRANIVQMWSGLRRQPPALRDTATSLAEDERTALLFLHQRDRSPQRAGGEAPAG